MKFEISKLEQFYTKVPGCDYGCGLLARNRDTVVEVKERYVNVVEQFGHINTGVTQEEDCEPHRKALSGCGKYPDGR